MSRNGLSALDSPRSSKLRRKQRATAQFQPTAFELLENRIVLASSSLTVALATSGAPCAHPAPLAAGAVEALQTVPLATSGGEMAIGGSCTSRLLAGAALADIAELPPERPRAAPLVAH